MDHLDQLRQLSAYSWNGIPVMKRVALGNLIRYAVNFFFSVSATSYLEPKMDQLAQKGSDSNRLDYLMEKKRRDTGLLLRRHMNRFKRPYLKTVLSNSVRLRSGSDGYLWSRLHAIACRRRPLFNIPFTAYRRKPRCHWMQWVKRVWPAFR